MKNTILTFTILLFSSLFYQVGYSQDVEIPFSWASVAPSTNSSTGVIQCGGMNISLTSGSPHQLSGTSARFPAGGLANLPVTLSFSKPVCNLGVLIRDLDEGGGGPSELVDFTSAPLPIGFNMSLGGPLFSYIGTTADPDGLGNTEGWVNWDAPVTSVSFDYNRTNPNWWVMSLDSLRFDCDCGIPTDLNCCEGNGWQTLSWAEVPGAVGYEIEFGFNDTTSSCCPTYVEPPTGWLEPLVDNVFVVPAAFPDCFWWRVRSVFADGSKSEWSEKVCDCFEEDVLPCEAPINLDCDIHMSTGERTLSWDPVAGAFGYVVSITYNDPACCDPSPDPIETFEINTTDAFLSGIGPNPCFSWKVRTICTDDPTFSDWSETKCSSDCVYPTVKKKVPGRIEIKDGPQSNPPNFKMSLVPNPANEFVTVHVINDKHGVKYDNAILSITTIEGIEVYRNDFTMNTPNQIEVKHLKTGIYLCQVTNGDVILGSSKLIIK